MNKFVLEAQLHTLFHNWSVQSTGIWIAVLLLHFFLWSALNSGRNISALHQNQSTYLLVTPITLKNSALTLDVLKNSEKEVSKISKMSSKLVRREQYAHAKTKVKKRKIVIPTAEIDQQRLNELPSIEKASESKRPSLPSGHDGSPKQARKLDFDEMKRTALVVTHEPPKRLLPGADKRISKSQRFSEAIDHAKRGDCRSEHAHLGILAIPFLLKDTITGEGCKW